MTTALSALVAHAPADLALRIYTAAALGSDAPTYLALRSMLVPIPFYGEMSMYVPRCREYLRRIVADRVDVLHLTTPGLMGLAALWVARKTRLPLMGSFHTDLATYTTLLSGSARLGRWMGECMRWMYGHCLQTLVPSFATRDLLIEAGSDPARFGSGLEALTRVCSHPSGVPRSKVARVRAAAGTAVHRSRVSGEGAAPVARRVASPAGHRTAAPVGCRRRRPLADMARRPVFRRLLHRVVGTRRCRRGKRGRVD